MKNLAKVLAVILALAMITVFAASCGSSSKDTGSSLSSLKDKDDKEKDDEDEDDDYSSLFEDEDDDYDSLFDDDDDSSTGTYTTAEEYLQSAEGQKEIESVRDTYKDYFDIEIYAEGNDMYYDYKYTTMYDEETAEALIENLDEGLESQASTFESVVEMMEDCVIGDVTLTVIYRNADGTLLTERTFY